MQKRTLACPPRSSVARLAAGGEANGMAMLAIAVMAIGAVMPENCPAGAGAGITGAGTTGVGEGAGGLSGATGGA